MPNQFDSDSFNALVQFSDFSSRAIFSYDMDNKRFPYFNPAFKQILEMSRKSAVEDPISLLEIVHPEDKDYVIRSYKKIIDNKAVKDVEFRIQLSDKSVKWLCLNAVMSEQEPQRRIIAGGIDDITHISKKNALLKKSIAQKASILEILAHDLAGPLINIKEFSSLIADGLKQHEDPELDEMIKMITKTSERSIRLIREYVTQESLESTTVEVIKKRIDIVEKLREIINQYKKSEESIAKTFNLHSQQENIYLKIDVFKIIQVIQNLISNAIKFTHDGGVINLYIEEKEEDVLFIVADNGIGIPAKFHENLFEKFTKARRKGLKGETSTGLGMSIIKTIVEWHEGRIWFESEENKGTTFYIELPKE